MVARFLYKNNKLMSKNGKVVVVPAGKSVQDCKCCDPCICSGYPDNPDIFKNPRKITDYILEIDSIPDTYFENYSQESISRTSQLGGSYSNVSSSYSLTISGFSALNGTYNSTIRDSITEGTCVEENGVPCRNRCEHLLQVASIPLTGSYFRSASEFYEWKDPAGSIGPKFGSETYSISGKASLFWGSGGFVIDVWCNFIKTEKIEDGGSIFRLSDHVVALKTGIGSAGMSAPYNAFGGIRKDCSRGDLPNLPDAEIASVPPYMLMLSDNLTKTTEPLASPYYPDADTMDIAVSRTIPLYICDSNQQVDVSTSIDIEECASSGERESGINEEGEIYDYLYNSWSLAAFSGNLHGRTILAP